MENAGQVFEAELEILRTEAESAAQFLYAYLAIHEIAAQHSEIAKLLNIAPLFWNTTLGALQTSAFIAVGRVFDDDKESHGVARLLCIATENPQIFNHASLAARKQGNNPTKPDWLDKYMLTAYEPIPADFEALQHEVDKQKASYKANYKPIRNKIFAHKDIKGSANVQEMFAQTNIVEFQTLTLFPQSIYSALWNLYHNGSKPDLQEHPLAVADMVREPIPAGRQVPVHVKIARQAADFLLALAKEDKNQQ
jgi:hypothetical protein